MAAYWKKVYVQFERGNEYQTAYLSVEYTEWMSADKGHEEVPNIRNGLLRYKLKSTDTYSLWLPLANVVVISEEPFGTMGECAALPDDLETGSEFHGPCLLMAGHEDLHENGEWLEVDGGQRMSTCGYEWLEDDGKACVCNRLPGHAFEHRSSVQMGMTKEGAEIRETRTRCTDHMWELMRLRVWMEANGVPYSDEFSVVENAIREIAARRGVKRENAAKGDMRGRASVSVCEMSGGQNHEAHHECVCKRMSNHKGKHQCGCGRVWYREGENIIVAPQIGSGSQVGRLNEEESKKLYDAGYRSNRALEKIREIKDFADKELGLGLADGEGKA